MTVGVRANPNPNPSSSRPIIDSSNACNQSSAHIVCKPLHGRVQFAIHRGVRLVGPMFTPRLPSPFGDRHPALLSRLKVIVCRNTLHYSSGHAHSSSQTASRSVQPFLYCMGPKCYAVQCIVKGKKTKTAPSLGILSLCRRKIEPRQRKHGQKLGNNRACSSGDIIADRQTYRQTDKQTNTQTYSSQYFAPLPLAK